jgi:cyanophycinase-like exopeptidase
MSFKPRGKYNKDMVENNTSPGPVVMIGSGETSPASGIVFEKLAKRYNSPLRIAIMETPAGFELNSSRVAGRVGDFLANRLQNYNPVIDVIPARKKVGIFSPDNEAILEPLYSADLIFLGPGSPTYTTRQLEGSLAYEIIQARQRTGASLILASAATIAFGYRTMPVYEIFKAGMDLHWLPGLSFFRHFGLNLIIIPHWNNAEGGAELDTSRCFMGVERFEQLESMLEDEPDILGIDEHTSIWLDMESRKAWVLGKGKIHLIRNKTEQQFGSGQMVPFFPENGYTPSIDPFDGIRQSVWSRLEQVSHKPQDELVPDQLIEWFQQRELARKVGDYPQADSLRKKIEECNWKILDTADGSRLEKSK